MEILQLKYFYESAINESFAKTAEKYQVPQTSVSASVKRLEKELGCELFLRTCNRISLNENGKKLKNSLFLVFSELDKAVSNISSKTPDTREIKLLVRAIRSSVADRIIEYKKINPHISFKTSFNFDETDFDNYDIIIDEKNDNYKNYEKSELFTAKVRLRVPKSSHLYGKELTLKELKNESFVTIGENNGLHKILLSACKKAGFSPNIVVSSNDLSCNKKFVDAGLGIGLAREYNTKPSSPDTKYLNVSDFNETQTIFCYCKKDSAYGNVKDFLDFLKKKPI